jgi:hypothetical protein
MIIQQRNSDHIISCAVGKGAGTLLAEKYF